MSLYLLIVDVPGDLRYRLAAPRLADEDDVCPLVVGPHHAVTLDLALSLRPGGAPCGQTDVGVSEKTIIMFIMFSFQQ